MRKKGNLTDRKSGVTFCLGAGERGVMEVSVHVPFSFHFYDPYHKNGMRISPYI